MRTAFSFKSGYGKSMRDLAFDKLCQCGKRFNVIANDFENSQQWNGHWFKLEKTRDGIGALVHL
jgi:hypothetical protein